MGLGSNVRADVGGLTWAWWLLVLVGLLGIAAGVVVLVEPKISLETLAVITGIFLLVDGIMEVVVALFNRVESRGLVATFGVISAIVGVILIRHPFGTVVAVALLLGLWLVVAGVLRLIGLFDQTENRPWSAILAVLELVAGIVIVASPGIGVTTLAVLIGIGFILRGLITVALGWSLHGIHRDAGHVNE